MKKEQGLGWPGEQPPGQAAQGSFFYARNSGHGNLEKAGWSWIIAGAIRVNL